MAHAQLAQRALRPWLVHAARRPLPKGAPETGPLPVQTAMSRIGDGDGLLEVPLSAQFVLARSGRRVDDAEAAELWRGLREKGILSLSGRELCDFLHVLGTARQFEGHPDVAKELAQSPWDRHGELKLWPQTLPLVCEYLVRHLRDRALLGRFLSAGLVPFWELHPGLVHGTLVPHHAMAVSQACAQVSLAPEATEVVRSALSRWTEANCPRLGPRGVANMALALSRLRGLGGEEANARLLHQLLIRAGQLLDEAQGSAQPKEPFRVLSLQFFRADWLGIFLSALAKARCRKEPETLRRLLEVHFPPFRGKSLLASEPQNLALSVHTVLKLDLLRLDLAGSPPLVVLAPDVKHALRGLKGASGARSACLLAHAYGSALLLAEEAQELRVYDEVLQNLFELMLSMKLSNIRLRFQLLSAVQCWFLVRGPTATVAPLRRAQALLRAVAPQMPGPEESIGDQDLISTKGHYEVAEALPEAVQARAVMEHFAFPFWLDIVLSPSRQPLPGKARPAQRPREKEPADE
ncbi:unnamed protein product [Effrenium voratum]|nr:unnamed protein product [Effrenium voratum]